MPKLQVPISKSVPEIKEIFKKGGWMAVSNYYNISVPDIVSLLYLSGYLDEVRNLRKTKKK